MGSKSSQANSAQTTQNYDQRQVNSTTIDDRDLTNVYDWSDHSTRTNIDNSIRVQDSSDRRQSWTDNSDSSIRLSDSSDRSNRQSWDNSIDVRDSSDRSNRQSWDNSIDVRDSSDRSQSWYSEVNDSSQRNTTTVNWTGTDAGAAKLLEGISRDQTDGIKTIAGFGDDALRRMGESATSLYATAGSNAVRSFDLATQRSTDAWAATVEKSTGLIDSLLKGASNTVNAARDISQQAITSFQPAENKAQDTSLKLGMIAAAGVAVLMLTRNK
jgi:hypothetical protein